VLDETDEFVLAVADERVDLLDAGGAEQVVAVGCQPPSASRTVEYRQCASSTCPRP
jgi:hypothetical protein